MHELHRLQNLIKMIRDPVCRIAHRDAGQTSKQFAPTGAVVLRVPATILVIDDIPANLGLVVQSLETEGHRVLVAQDGEEGLLRAEAEKPDLILLDVMMQGLNGYDVCGRLRAGPATTDIPVIFMTALGNLQDKLAGFAAGGVDYIAKPLQVAELLSRVRTHLELSSLRRQLAVQNLQLKREQDELERRVLARTADLQAEVEERRRAESELQKSSEQIRDLYDHAPCGYHSLDENGIFVRINDTELNWLGVAREDLVGKRRLTEFLSPESVRKFARTFPLLKQRGWVRDLELTLIRRDGRTVPVLLSATAVRAAGGGFVMTRTTLYDLSERKQSEERIRYLASHDALTGLSNRTLFQTQLGRFITQGRRRHESVAVMFLDLDQFNQINDSFGHHVGDLILCEVSKRLSLCLRESDALARWGGDEFVVALTAPVSTQAALLTAEKLLETLKVPIVADQHEFHVGGSIGISFYPNDGKDVQTLLRAADTAMYHAKKKGRSRVELFAPALAANIQHRMNLGSQLRQALERQELYLHYQPQVDMETGKIFGAEALLRWQHPKLGPVSPAEFIPVAEETGLIQSLGAWVLRQACQQIRRWHEEGFTWLRVAVNLSAPQLLEVRFVDDVARVLDETGCPGWALEFEITENVLLQSSEENVRILNAISNMGIGLSVDDFGIGYSSLSYLQSFPINALKIDRAFVNRIGQKLQGGAIVEAIIAMAQSLHLRMLAEGVETEEQIAFLKACGCRAAQGYYYSRPVSAECFSQLLGQSIPGVGAAVVG
jgi:diguanylate cyclase (GGDEF)-like protein/PAS domain S-box-containing protein